MIVATTRPMRVFGFFSHSVNTSDITSLRPRGTESASQCAKRFFQEKNMHRVERTRHDDMTKT